MALKDIHTGEMLDILRDWQTEKQKEIFERYALTNAFLAIIQEVYIALTEAVTKAGTPLTAEEKKKISKLLKALDDEFDDSARVLIGLLELGALAFPDMAAQYRHASYVLLPDGLSIINTSYRNEAGETERIVKRVSDDSITQGILDSVKLNDKKARHWYDKLVDQGRSIGPMAAKLRVSDDRREGLVLEFKARQRWISMVTTLRRNCELAGWTDEEMGAIFDQVDKLAARRKPPTT